MILQLGFTVHRTLGEEVNHTRGHYNGFTSEAFLASAEKTPDGCGHIQKNVLELSPLPHPQKFNVGVK